MDANVANLVNTFSDSSDNSSITSSDGSGDFWALPDLDSNANNVGLDSPTSIDTVFKSFIRGKGKDKEPETEATPSSSSDYQALPLSTKSGKTPLALANTEELDSDGDYINADELEDYESSNEDKDEEGEKGGKGEKDVPGPSPIFWDKKLAWKTFLPTRKLVKRDYFLFYHLPLAARTCFFRHVLVKPYPLTPYEYRKASSTVPTTMASYSKGCEAPELAIIQALCNPHNSFTTHLRDEARNVLYGENRFIFADPKSLASFLSLLGADCIGKMQVGKTLMAMNGFWERVETGMPGANWMRRWGPGMIMKMKGARVVEVKEMEGNESERKGQGKEKEEPIQKLLEGWLVNK